MTSSPQPRRAVAAVRRLGGVTALAALAVTGVAVIGGTSAASAAPTVVATPLVAAGVVGLSSGSNGPAVLTLQQALIDAGIDVDGGADGWFGPATHRAVKQFQQARGLPSTGVVDEATATSLANNGPTTADDAATASSGLTVGARGDDVLALQEQLIEGGAFLLGGADGVFGPATQRALTQFQRWNALEPTGVLDNLTARRLGLVRATRNPEPSPAVTAEPDGYVGLAQGMSGERVRQLQAALQSIGLVVRGGADGVFGPATASALRAFQSFNRLPQDGVLSARGAELLGLGESTSQPASDPLDEYVGLGVGTRGDAVKDVQRALAAAGINVVGGADGVFGNQTRLAVEAYQSGVGLTATGAINRATAEKLGLGSSAAPEAPSAPDTGASEQTSDDPYVGLTIGDVGPLVTELQRALQSTGLVVRGGADGVFGPATASALKAFQSVNGISQTGVLTATGKQLLGLGTGQVGISNPNPSSASFNLERFPVQGICFFGDTWHAPRGNGRLHVGTDVIADEGKLLYAVADGEITKLFWDQPGALAGNGVRLTQPNGTYYIYLHMFGFAPGIEVGTQVKAGDVIGTVGNTGSSATAHLHFEIHPGGGDPINPYQHMKAIDGCSDTEAKYQASYAS
ncbi:MAG: peptidoglycan-binding protein [Ilumatobacter sp.]